MKTFPIAVVVPMMVAGCSNTTKPSATPPAGQKEAVAQINSAGGSVKYQDGDPNKPVIEVYLKNAKLSEATLKAVANLGHLKKLELDDSNLTSDDLAHVKDLTELEILWISDTKVTDEGLVHLKGLTNLDWLALTGTDISDAGLAHLSELSSLTKIDVQGTKVTNEGAEKLMKSLPKLEKVVR
jgi:Leucine-rich repeat (LRR) protein